MKNFNVRDMSDLLYDILSVIKDFDRETECILTMPTTESVFPCRVINTPLESVGIIIDGIPLRKIFQVTIECWAEKQRDVMQMDSNTSSELLKKAFIKTATVPIFYDEITHKYRYINTYEVIYNCLTNSFEYINR